MENTLSRVKIWIAENAPMLQVVYQNKYVGMVYDRFGSLPSKQQKQVLLGIVGGGAAIILGFLLFSYLSLWSYSRRTNNAYDMVNLLLNYQKERRDKGAQIEDLERNNQLAVQGRLKQYILDQGRNASISPRMMKVEEIGSPGAPEDEAKGGQDVQLKQATASLEHINLNQLKAFLQNIEFGPYNLSISSLKITNDDKIRGFMKADLNIVAYLFQSDENL